MAFKNKTIFYIYILAGLALSPLYGVLSKEPNFFLAHNSDPTDFIILISLISVVFPLVIAVAITIASHLFGGKQKSDAKIFIAILVTVIILPFSKIIMKGNVSGTFIMSLLMGLIFAFAFYRFSAPKLFLKFISPAILIFPALFFFEPRIFVLAVPEYTQEDFPKVSIPEEVPVVFILFDEFPLSFLLNEKLLIDKLAFPNFARLASNSHWYRNASTNYAFTGHAIRSIFTGLPQDNSRFGTYKFFPNNIFTLLGYDYEVEAYESALRLCPPNICVDSQKPNGLKSIEIFWKDIGAVYLNSILPQPQTFGVPGISQSYIDFWGNSVKEEPGFDKHVINAQNEFGIPFLEPNFEEKQLDGRERIFKNFLEKLDSTPRKKFYFLHILFPHQPYRFSFSGKKYDSKGVLDSIGLNEKYPKGGTWSDDEWLIKIQNQKLYNQMGYTDFLLGKLLDRLDGKNLFNSSLFILAADHGVNIVKGGFRREANKDSHENIASIPLFIKLPGQKEGVVSDLPATLIDILPSLADVLNIEVPWDTAGQSLFDMSDNPRKRILHDYQLMAHPIPNDLKQKLKMEVKRRHSIFGNFNRWESLRILDEYSEKFMNKPVSEFSVQVIKNIAIELDMGSHVERTSNFIPAIVKGRVTGIENKDEWKALISVNGIFQAVSPIVNLGDDESILAFLPENAFREGVNDVEVYLVREPFEKEPILFKPRLK